MLSKVTAEIPAKSAHGDSPLVLLSQLRLAGHSLQELGGFLSAFSGQSDVQNSQKQKFSKWAALVPKVLVDLMATFSARLEPPNAHIKLKSKYLKKITEMYRNHILCIISIFSLFRDNGTP